MNGTMNSSITYPSYQYSRYKQLNSNDHVILGPSVRSLDANVIDRIVSSGFLSTVHKMTEEIILNSIDAKATLINVYIGRDQLVVEDNGNGISLKAMEYIGDWNWTTKHLSASTNTLQSCKGITLAAVCKLCDVVRFTSRSSSLNRVEKKSFVKGENISSCEWKDTDHHNRFLLTMNQGTIVDVKGLFEQIPVRKRNINMSKEISLIKTFITKMSVLYHNVTWTFVDLVTNTTLYHATSQPSVQRQVIKWLGSNSIAAYLKNINFSFPDESNCVYSINGLITIPLSKACYNSKEYQCCFINQRLLRVNNVISTEINDIYTFILDNKGSGGPASKHSNLFQQEKCIFPVFVLQFHCVDKELELFDDGESSTIVFSNLPMFRQCLYKCLSALFQVNKCSECIPLLNTYFREKLSSMQSTMINKTNNTPNSKSAMVSRSKNEVSTESTFFQVSFANYQFKENNPSHSTLLPSSTTPTSTSDLFNMAFVESDSSSSLFTSEHLDHYPSPTTKIVPEIGVVITKERLTETQPTIENQLTKDILFSDDPIEDSINAPTFAKFTWKGYKSKPRKRFFDEFNDETNQLISQLNAHQNECTAGDSVNNTQPDLVSYTSPTIHDSSSNQQAASKYFKTTNLTKLNKTINDASVSRIRDEKLTKYDLQSIVVIGQIDNKYIAAWNSLKGLLLLLDQHAIDERLRFEAIMNDLTTLESCRLPSPVTVTLSTTDIDLLDSFREILNQWHFYYEIIRSNHHVVVTSVTSYMQEQLSVEDMIEFARFLSENYFTLTTSMLKPPALQRIAASKACRGAIKFNQTLTVHQCQQLVRKWATCDFPFQCAHGRPSLYPVANLQALISNKK